MKVHGMLVALLDIPPELTEEYNRWYDLDHLPEHISKDDVLIGRRYVAPRDLQGLGSTTGDVTGGHPPYLTTYLFGVPDFDGPVATGGWTTKDRTIVKAGRFFREGKVRFSRLMRLGGATPRASLLVSEEAIPYVAHRGVVLAVGRAPTPEQRPDAVRWWEETHLADLLAVEGVIAALRLDPIAADDPELIVHLLLLEAEPVMAMARIERALRYSAALGRYPAHGGVYESLAFLPYRSIVPLEYDFDW